jgi:hypothetical protein
MKYNIEDNKKNKNINYGNNNTNKDKDVIYLDFKKASKNLNKAISNKTVPIK